MLTTIPFAGFYDSVHTYELDKAQEMMIQDSSGCNPISDTIAEEFCGESPYPMIEYAKWYLERFQRYFNEETSLDIAFTWDSLDSPREYNFSTDRIFATVSDADVVKLYLKVDRVILNRLIREKFTSQSGFISHYEPSLASWQQEGDVLSWDHNQIGTLIEAVMQTCEFKDDWEQDVISDADCNGDISNMVYDALTVEGKRLVKLADYLRERYERRFRYSRPYDLTSITKEVVCTQ